MILQISYLCSKFCKRSNIQDRFSRKRDSNTVLLLFKTLQANVLSPLERQAFATA